MGCDIHAYLELLFDDEWVFIAHLPKQRRYEVFGWLSGVRGNAHGSAYFPERGLPKDASPGLVEERDGWGDDGHSGTFFNLVELRGFCEFYGSKHIFFVRKWLRLCEKAVEVGAQDARITIWYDN